jgi:hypothetical protein
VRPLCRRPVRGDEGAALIMALIFLSVFSIVISVLLTMADTDFRTTVNVRSQRKDVYAADGVIEAAVNYYRNTGFCIGSGSLPAFNGVTNATVGCDSDGGGTGGAANLPPLALIARADAGEDGIRVLSGGGTARTRVRGGAFSNTAIDVTGGATLEVTGPVTARTVCSGAGTITTTDPPLNCSIGSASYPNGDDPGYSAAVATAPATAVLPSCPSGGAPVVMAPGTYSNAAALNALFSACANRVFHFPAGVYYFNFTNASGGHQWNVTGANTIVVGGTLPTGVTLTTTPFPAVGSRCDESSPAGVQFVFGGDSRLNIDSGEMELCAPHDVTETSQEIAVYGLKTGSGPTGGGSTTVTLVPTSGTPTPSTEFTPAAGAFTPSDSSVATATLDSSTDADRTASLRVEGYPVTGIPSGATITGVSLKLRHQEQTPEPNLAQLDLSAVVTGGAGATSSFNVSKSEDAYAVHTQALPSSFNNVLQLTNLKVDYTASTNLTNNNHRSFTSLLDGATIEVTYTTPVVPGFTAQSGCIVEAPYDPTDNDTCALVRTGGSQADFAVHGTVYAPKAALDIHLVGISYQVFRRGLIVRHLRSNVTPSTTCANTALPVPEECYPFQLPSGTSAPENVVFVASVDGRPRVRALVRFPLSGGAPEVLSWSAINES